MTNGPTAAGFPTSTATLAPAGRLGEPSTQLILSGVTTMMGGLATAVVPPLGFAVCAGASTANVNKITISLCIVSPFSLLVSARFDYHCPHFVKKAKQIFFARLRDWRTIEMFICFFLYLINPAVTSVTESYKPLNS